jgi:glycosyltransferase involved in cell wall biosynthesis
MRVLHIVGGMNRGGVETWLMHVLRHIDRDRFRMDFLAHTDQPCAYDDEIRLLGSQVIACPLDKKRPWEYARNFKRILREHGPYDVVHSHVHHFSGYTLWLAHQAHVPMRIAHSHNDTTSVDRQARLPRRLYLRLAEYLVRRYMSVGLSCSRQAAAALYGTQWENNPKVQILYYGIDLSPFHESVDSMAVRQELGIPPDAFVVGHVGRFYVQKNHTFLVDIALEVAQQEPRMYLLLVGEGPLRPEIEHKVAHLGLVNRVIFTGSRSDVPRLMMGAMDIFLMPSLHEGLPMVGIESQAAGLPLIISDAVTSELDIVKPLVHRLSLRQSAEVWAEQVLQQFHTSSPAKRAEALENIKKSIFNVQKSAEELQKIYFQETLHGRSA